MVGGNHGNALDGGGQERTNLREKGVVEQSGVRSKVVRFIRHRLHQPLACQLVYFGEINLESQSVTSAIIERERERER